MFLTTGSRDRQKMAGLQKNSANRCNKGEIGVKWDFEMAGGKLVEEDTHTGEPDFRRSGRRDSHDTGPAGGRGYHRKNNTSGAYSEWEP